MGGGLRGSDERSRDDDAERRSFCVPRLALASRPLDAGLLASTGQRGGSIGWASLCVARPSALSRCGELVFSTAASRSTSGAKRASRQVGVRPFFRDNVASFGQARQLELQLAPDWRCSGANRSPNSR